LFFFCHFSVQSAGDSRVFVSAERLLVIKMQHIMDQRRLHDLREDST